MRHGLIILAALCLFLAAAPAFAQGQSNDWSLNGNWSIGLGGGFGQKNTAPFAVSGKYWDPSWELGAEAFTDFKSKSKDNDQFGQAWLAYRYDLGMGKSTSGMKSGITYVGVGVSGIFKSNDPKTFGKKNTYNNKVGPMLLVGWDSNNWGVEVKGAWYDPVLVSAIVYYTFGPSKK